MDRAKAIEWLEQLRDEEELNAKLFEMDEHPRDMDNPHTPWVEMYEMALAALREQLVTTCNQWISVEERLPEKITGKVLVCCKNGYIGIGRYEKIQGVKEWYNYVNFKPFREWDLEVTHWMPLPEPPEGGAEG